MHAGSFGTRSFFDVEVQSLEKERNELRVFVEDFGRTAGYGPA